MGVQSWTEHVRSSLYFFDYKWYSVVAASAQPDMIIAQLYEQLYPMSSRVQNRL